jgi:hypothetical protein
LLELKRIRSPKTSEATHKQTGSKNRNCRRTCIQALLSSRAYKSTKRKGHRARSPKTPQYDERFDFHYSSILPTRKQEFFSKKLTYYTNIEENQEEFTMQKTEHETVHPAVEIKRNKNNIPAS